jgi:coproporphyrinogen III oxidase-like Fe-S oxidoreductase
MMSEDRLMVAEAVINGLIGEEYLTLAEIDEIFERLSDAITDKLLAEAEQRGCSVFDGVDGDTLQ